jgi:hypothetical protein
MSIAPDNVEELLNQIRNTIIENKKFLQDLEEENNTQEDEQVNVFVSKDQENKDDFEEL